MLQTERVHMPTVEADPARDPRVILRHLPAPTNVEQLSLLTSKLASALPPGTFLSPCSIHLALALVASGATGQTLVELQTALDWPTGPNWQQQLAQLLSSLWTVTGGGGPVIAVANRVFTRIAVDPQFAAAVQSTFGATIEPLQSATQVNEFVSTATQRMITHIVEDRMITPSTAMIAINALFFKGTWEVQLHKADTLVAPFTTRATVESASRVENCHLMRTPRGKKWRYYEDSSAQYVLMPYSGAGGAIAAVVALPKDVGADPLRTANFGAALAALRTVLDLEGTVWLPRFAVESATELSSVLKEIGVRRAFTHGTEFGGIAAGGLHIDEVLHKVKVEVDEEGTVAAAATAALTSFGISMPTGPPPFQMRCDRPFAFAVAHVPSGLVLFAGGVENPGCVGDAPPSQPQPTAPSQPQPAVLRFGTTFGGSSVAPPVTPNRFNGPSVPTPAPFPNGPVAPTPAPSLFDAPVAPTPAPSLFDAPVAPTPAPLLSLDQRRQQACLFTAACRRDVYRVLCAAPRGPLRASQRLFGPFAPTRGGGGFDLFGVGAAPPCVTGSPLRWVFDASGSGVSFGFGSGSGGVHSGRPQLVLAGTHTAAADVARTLAAIETVGQPTADGIAFTEALEALLVREYVGWWDDADAATLSTAFLVAFGNELTPRLDLEHALRSRPLPHDDLVWLRALSPAIAFNRGLIDAFQSI